MKRIITIVQGYLSKNFLIMQQATIKLSILVSILSAINSFLGFISQMVMAYLFGATFEMDAYVTATALPTAVTGIFSGGLGFIIIPTLMKYKDNRAGFVNLVSSMFCFFIIIGMIVILCNIWYGNFFIKLMAPHLSAEKFHLVIKLYPLSWLMVAFNIIGCFFIAVHHAHKKFVLAILSLSLQPICIIITGLIFAHDFGIVSIIWGGILGNVLQVCILSPLVLNCCSYCIKKFPSQAFKTMFSSMLLMTFSTLPFTILSVSDAFWSAHLSNGSLSYITYASRLVTGFSSVLAQGIAIVLFPGLAENVVDKNFFALKKKLNLVKKIMFLTIPLIILIFFLRIPILKILFQRGHFDSLTTNQIALVLPYYLIGMFAMIQVIFTQRFFFAFQDFKNLILFGGILIFGYFVLSGILSNYYTFIGIGMAFAIYWNLMLLIHYLLLHKKIQYKEAVVL